MRAWAALIHVFTALGAVCALMAALAVFDHSAPRLFFWLAVALFVDGIDGTFARAVRVSERLPRFSGERLDLVVDYLTYVFVPAMALLTWRYLDGTTGLVLAFGILLSSLFHFSDLESKTKDNCFVGFPAVWNIVAFYIFALDLSSPAASALVALAVAGTFVPMPRVHPLRVVALRNVTLLMTAVFCGAGLWTVARGFPAEPLAQAALLAAAAYFIALSVLWSLRTK